MSSSPNQPPHSADPDETPDIQLVERCQKGDLTAFDTLVTRYRGRVYGMLFNMVRNETDAWDLAQDSFLKAWKALPTFRNDSAFFTWLYRIAHNVALDWLRARKNRPGPEFDDTIPASAIEPGAPTAPHPEIRPDDRLAGTELAARINSALSQLSPEHRAVVLLRELDGLSYEEIAERLGVAVGTVMSRLFNARKKLQTLLADVRHSSDWQ